VESNAPATTPDAVVSLDEHSEVVPGLRREHSSRQRHPHSVPERSDIVRIGRSVRRRPSRDRQASRPVAHL
jgi:hypothetical protein